MIFALSLKQMGSNSFHTFIYARSEQCDVGPIYTITNKQHIRIYPGKLKFILVKISPDPGRLHDKHAIENQTLFTFLTTENLSRLPRFTRVQIRSLFRFVQLCCKFTRVNAFTPWYKRVGAYLGDYLSTFLCVLIFIRVDPNLHIVSKRIKLIRTNIYKVLQFSRVNLPSVNGALIEGPTYLLII